MMIMGVIVAMVVMVVAMVIMIMTMVIVIVTILLQEMGLQLHDPIKVEGVATEDLVQGHIRARRLVEFGVGVDGADPHFDIAQLGRRDEVRLVEEDDVGEGDLVLGLRCIAQPILEPLRVGDRDDSIEARLIGDILIDKEGLRDGRGIGKACCLDEDGVEATLAFHQAVNDAD